jgi:DNA-binding TFAR19-related protein (PDSD5 family)
MTKLLQKALEAVRLLPPENQDEIARAMLSLAGDESVPEDIDPAHLADVLSKLRPRSAVSANEAAVHSARYRKPY